MSIHKLIDELEKTRLGIHLSNYRTVSALLYANDVLLMTDNKEDFSALVKVYGKLCAEFRAATNADKPKYTVFLKRQRGMNYQVITELTDDDSDDDMDVTFYPAYRGMPL